MLFRYNIFLNIKVFCCLIDENIKKKICCCIFEFLDIDLIEKDIGYYLYFYYILYKDLYCFKIFFGSM